MSWCSRESWVEHSRRLGGLFDEDFIPQLAKVLGRDEQHWRELWRLSCEETWVRSCGGAQRDDDLFHDVSDAWVFSALLRGRFHDHMARAMGGQIVHHPFRAPMLPGHVGGSSMKFEVGNTSTYLANAILAAAFAEGTTEKRIAAWVDSAKRCRELFQAGELDLTAREREIEAQEAALKAARTAGFRVHPKWLDDIVEITLSIGTGAITSFALEPWTGFAVGTAVFGVSKAAGTPKRLIHPIATSGRRLRDLATAGPGRIDRNW